MNREIKCKQCGELSIKKPRDGRLFCNRACYMDWKRLNPNRKAYNDEGRVIISGYAYLYMPAHPFAIKNGRYIGEHRVKLEEKIGRFLTSFEVAHHINGDILDNRPENLELMSVDAHNSHHAIKRERNKNGTFC